MPLCLWLLINLRPLTSLFCVQKLKQLLLILGINSIGGCLSIYNQQGDSTLYKRISRQNMHAGKN
jgi:hypothetical protein